MEVLLIAIEMIELQLKAKYFAAFIQLLWRQVNLAQPHYLFGLTITTI